MKFQGTVIKYGDNVDTDVIIPARYLNTIDKKELASHCMEDLDTTFTQRVKPGDIMVAGENFGCGSSREHAPIAIKESGISLVIAKRLWNVRKQQKPLKKDIQSKQIWTTAFCWIRPPESRSTLLHSRHSFRPSSPTAD